MTLLDRLHRRKRWVGCFRMSAEINPCRIDTIRRGLDWAQVDTNNLKLVNGLYSDVYSTTHLAFGTFIG
jgi:hypothetical protein